MKKDTAKQIAELITEEAALRGDKAAIIDVTKRRQVLLVHGDHGHLHLSLCGKILRDALLRHIESRLKAIATEIRNL